MFISEKAAFHTSSHSIIMCLKPDKTERLDCAQMFGELLTGLWRYRNRGQPVGVCGAWPPALRAHRYGFLNPTLLGKSHLCLMSV